MNPIAEFLLPFAEVAINIAGALLLGLGTVAAKKAADWLNLAAEDRVRGYFLEALDRAIAYARDQALKQLPPIQDHDRGDGVLRDTADAVVGIAAGYLRDRVPDALAQLKIDGVGLDAVISARMAQK